MMKHSIPSPFSSSWKSRLVLQCHHALFQEAINFHIEKIRQIITSKPAVHRALSQPEVWNSLNNSMPAPQLDKLQLYWGKVKPLAHLNSSALYLLLSEQVNPLEKHLECMLDELNADDFKKEESSLWRPAWFDATLHNLILEAQENLTKVKSLKAKINEAMLQRCELHQNFQLDYRVDDTLGVICQELNCYQLDETKRLAQPQVLSKIDDDTRITFYDILKNSSFEQGRLEHSVLGCIQKKSLCALTTNENVIAQLKNTTEYVYQTLASLNLDNVYRKIFTYKLQLVQTQALNTLVSPFVEALKALGLYHLLKYRTMIGYFLLFAASLIIYGYVVQLAAPLLMLSLSTAAIHAVNTFFFYTIGMAPLWYLCIKHARNIRDSLNSFFSATKRQALISALSTLERSEYFIANRLSQSIVDISNFDIECLVSQAESHRAMLRSQATSLRHFSLRQKMTSSPEFRQTLIRCALRLEQQQIRLENNLKLLAAQLATDISQEITLLSASAGNNKLVTCLSKNQLLKLQSMVNTYGTPQTITLFIQNTDILELFSKQLDVEHMAFKLEQRKVHYQPWGGYELRNDVIQGWNNLINTLLQQEKTRELLIRMNAILLGEAFDEDFIEVLNKHLPQQTHKIIEHFQWLLFNTISSKRPSMAALLSTQQKDLIAKWFYQYEQEIEQAQNVLCAIFSHSEAPDIDNNSLNSYFELLDGADIYYHAFKNEAKIKQRYNLARQYFEEYQGEHSSAFGLLKFVPKPEYLEMLGQVAKKRLTWLLAKVQNSDSPTLFEKSDGDLFHHFYLQSKQISFDFDDEIKRSEGFNGPYSVAMENFLRECQSRGFEGDDLLEQYIALHPNRPVLIVRNYPEEIIAPENIIELEGHQPRRKNTSIKVSRR